MFRTNIKIIAIAVIVVGFYTMVAHMIPQLESEVPEALDLSSGVTPEALVAAGEGIFNGAGSCTACHGLGTRAPNLLTDHAGEGTIGSRCGGREPGKDCKAYLYESLTQPSAYVVKGFDPIMPDMRRQFSPDQIWAIVAYLESQGGQVTVTAADIESTGGVKGGLSAPAAGGPATPADAPPAGAASGPPPAPATPAAPLDARQQGLVADGQGIFDGAGGCTACHGTGTLAPNLRTDHGGQGPIGVRCGSREKGKSCNEYLYESLTDAGAYVVQGFDPIMPDLRRKFSANQIWSLVAYLESLGGKVTVSAADMKGTEGQGAPSGIAQAPASQPSEASAGAAPQPAAAAQPAVPLDPEQKKLASAGEAVFNGEGRCTSCHGTGLLAPNLLTDHEGEGPIGARCGKREAGLECKAYLYRSLTEPSAFVVKGFNNIMPDMRQYISAEQIWSVIAFLESQGGKVTVTAADVAGQGAPAPAAGSAPAPAAEPPPAGGAPAASGTAPAPAAAADARPLLKEFLCLGCHGIDGKGGGVGPSFDGVGTRRNADSIRKKILDPASDTAEGFEAVAGTMPTNFSEKLSKEQLDTIVQFLAARK